MESNTWIEGRKDDFGKMPLSLLDRFWLEQTAGALMYGAQKYDAHNWRKGIAYSRLLDAALRHILAFNDGEDADLESGLSHLSHASCCLMFLTWMVKERPDLDDRCRMERALASIEQDLRAAILETHREGAA